MNYKFKKNFDFLNRRNFLKLLGAVSGFAALQVFFNNCAEKGFQVQSGSSSPSADPTITGQPGVLPQWVPAPGEVAKLSNENGGLTNRFSDIVAPYYEPFHSVKIVNDYSTHVYNKYWGAWGALVGFGGGHSGTNDNTVWTLEFGTENCTFKRLTNPAPIFGTGTDTLTKSKNSGYEEANGFRVNIDGVYGEYDYPGRTTNEPAAPHSYGALDIIGPINGGGNSGSLITTVCAAPGHAGVSNTGILRGLMIAAHQCDFPSLSGSAGDYFWQRKTINTGQSVDGAPAWTQLVSGQNRIYIETRSATAIQAPLWFDLNSNQYTRGTGTPRTNDGDTADTGILFDIPERGLLVFVDRSQGKVRIQFMKVGANDTNPSWMPAATLSLQIPATPSWQCACWCPDNNRIILGNVSGDPNCIYEVEIPDNLSDAWTAVRVPFLSGQTISWPGIDDKEGSPTYKKWSYCSRVRAIVYMPYSHRPDQGPEEIFVYRPRST